MPVPFGFSAGDFVTVLNLFKEIGLALRDHGGASEDYRRTVAELETVKAILQQLQSLPSAVPNVSYVNAIKGQALLLQNEVSGFLDRLARYDGALGHGSVRGVHRGVISKAKWAILVRKEVKELREIVDAQCRRIELLMSIHTT
jgi:hypothetical protein